MLVRAYAIEWDTDGEVVILPSEVIVEMENGLTAEEIEWELPDRLSDHTGWLVVGFSWERVKEVKE